MENKIEALIENNLTKKELVQGIKSIIEKKMCLDYNESDQSYTGELSIERGDCISDKLIVEIMKSSNPIEDFYEKLNEIFCDSDMYEFDFIFETIESNFELEFENKDASYSDYQDDISDWCYEHISFSIPYDNYLKQDVKCDIILDTGDGNYDFNKNNLFNYYSDDYEENDIDEETMKYSSLVWLMKQQSYAENEIKMFIKTEDCNEDKFLQSIYDESNNTTTSMNAVSFFVTMSLEDLIDFQETKNENKNKSILIKSSTLCGLYDPWCGAGGILDIKLKNDIVIPIEYIDSILPDGCRGYGIDDIYGMCSSFWKEKGFKIIEKECM